MVSSSSAAQSRVITLTPNRSASWSQTLLFLFIASFFLLVMGIVWAVVGAWMILPFAGLEIMLLAFFLHKVSYATYEKQVIRIESGHVVVENGHRQVDVRSELPRPEAHLSVKEGNHTLDPPILTLTDDEDRVSIGHFLNRDDALSTMEAFREAGIPICRESWWLTDKPVAPY